MVQTPTLTPATMAGLTIDKVQAEKHPYLNMLIYGDSGVGKTSLAGSADLVPELRPVLFVDIEGGTFSLQNFGYNVDVVRVKDWKEMQDLYNHLYNEKHPYQTVVLDSLTEIQKFNMYNILDDMVQKKPDADPDIAGLREYLKSSEQMRKYVRAFRDLDMHTIFTALAKTEKNDRTGVRETSPDLPGKLATQIPAFLDEVFYYYTKQIANPDEGGAINQRFLLTQKTESQLAKDRSGRLPIVVESPTLKTVLDLIHPPKAKA
jgi:hypothetical protein